MCSAAKSAILLKGGTAKYSVIYFVITAKSRYENGTHHFDLGFLCVLGCAASVKLKQVQYQHDITVLGISRISQRMRLIVSGAPTF